MIVLPSDASGNVTVSVDGKEFNATVVNGTAVIQLDNVTPGTHEVEVIYSGDDKYANGTKLANVTAPKYDSPISIGVPEIVSGENGTVVVRLPENATGNVTVSVDGKEYVAEVINGTAVVRIDNLTAGPKTVVVEYSGDDNYDSTYKVGNFTVEPAKASPDITVVDSGNGTVVVVMPSDATGNVTVKVDGKTYPAEIVNGTAVIRLDDVAPGEHDVEVIYGGDGKYSNATAKSKVTAPKYDTPIEVEAHDSYVGDKAIITVTLPANATGEVAIEIEGVKYTSQIKNGKAVFEIENLTAGTKTIAVDYAGDGSYAANHTAGKAAVYKSPSNVSATITDIGVGENVTVTVTVPQDATGQVLIDIDGVGYYVNVTGGVGTAQIPRMPNGIYDVNLTYTGDDKYLPSSNVSSFNVNKIPSFVIPTAQDIYVGDYEKITLKVPADATGNVTVVINGEEYNFNLGEGTLGASSGDLIYTVAVSDGNGELIIFGLPKGEYTVNVKYNGDSKYLPSVNSTTFIVSKTDSDVEVIDQGNGTVIVYVGDNASGTVEIKLGNETYSAEVVNGTAVVQLTDAAPGKHDVEVIYSGDETHGAKTVESSVTIPPYDCPISVDAHDIYVGETETVVVNLPEDATGTVTIEINGKQYTTDRIVNGKAEFNVTGLAVGNKTVAVKYSGDSKYKRNYTTGQFEVKKISSSVKATAKDIKVGKDGVITVTVSENATGKVFAKVNGVGYYADIINGKAKIVLSDLPAGKYDIAVMYEGDENYLPDNTTAKFTVSKHDSPTQATADDIYQGEDGNIVVNVPKDAKGSVTIKVNGRTFTAKVKNGKAVFVVPGLSNGVHDIDVYYSGDGKYKPSHTKTQINVNGDDSPNHEEGSAKHASAEMGISLSDYPTGNPIFVLLLIVLMVGETQIRRFRK